MRAADILNDAQEVFARCEGALLYERISDAIELLANESQWDAMNRCMTLNVGDDGCVVLPKEIEVPLAVHGIP